MAFAKSPSYPEVENRVDKAGSPVPEKARWSYAFLAVLGIAAFLFFFRLGAVPLFDGDEPRYAQAAREMLARHDWITPTFNGQLRFQKPIFIYWLILGAYRVFGVTEFAARFWSAIAGLAAVGMLHRFLVPRLGREAALLGAAALELNLQMLILARAATPDACLGLFIGGSLLAFYHAYQAPAAERGRYYLLFWGLLGLAGLTKGPVGIGIPLLAVGLFSLLERSLPRVARQCMPGWGVLVALAIMGPWYGAVISRHGVAFTEFFFAREHLERFSRPMENHAGPIFYYLPVVLAFFFPWCGLVPAGIEAALRRTEREQPDAVLARFCCVWAGLVLLVFSLSSTKLPHYVFPAYPALAVLAALGWKRLAAGSVGRAATRAGNGFAWFGMAVFLLGGLAAPWLGPKSGVRAEIGWGFLAAVLLASGALRFAMACHARGKMARAMPAQLAAAGILPLFLVLVSGPLHDGLYGGVVRLSRKAREFGPQSRFAVFRSELSAAVYYYGRPGVPQQVRDETQLREWQQDPHPTLLITRTGAVAKLPVPATLIAEDNRYALLRLNPAAPGSPGPGSGRSASGSSRSTPGSAVPPVVPSE